MSAQYLAKQIIRGGLSYDILIEPSKWAKFKDEVDAILIEMGRTDLIPGYEEKLPEENEEDEEFVHDEAVTLPEIDEEV